VKKKTDVVPDITIQKLSREENQHSKLKNRLKNHVLTKQMAKKLVGRRTTLSRLTSKITTVSEEM